MNRFYTSKYFLCLLFYQAGIVSPQLTLLAWNQLDSKKGTSTTDQATRHSIKLKALSK